MNKIVADKIINYQDIIHGLKKIWNGLNRENPVPSFVFTVESKIRAYEKKIRILKAQHCVTTKVYKCDKCGRIQ